MWYGVLMATKAELQEENDRLKAFLQALKLDPDQEVELGLRPERPTGKAHIEVRLTVVVPLQDLPGYWTSCGWEPDAEDEASGLADRVGTCLRNAGFNVQDEYADEIYTFADVWKIEG